jgi:hypothetical protein
MTTPSEYEGVDPGVFPPMGIRRKRSVQPSVAPSDDEGELFELLYYAHTFAWLFCIRFWLQKAGRSRLLPALGGLEVSNWRCG